MKKRLFTLSAFLLGVVLLSVMLPNHIQATAAQPTGEIGQTSVPTQSQGHASTSMAQAAAPLNKAFVSIQPPNSVDVLDTTSNTVIQPGIAWPKSPGAGIISLDGARLYLIGHGDGTVYGLNTSTYQIEATIALSGCDQRGIALAPDGTRLYVADNCLSKVTPIDLQTNTAGTPIPLSAHPEQIALSPDGSRLYVAANTPNQNFVIDTASNQVIQTFQAGSNPHGAAVSPDGQLIYIGNSNDGTISVISAASLGVVATFPAATGANALTITPDGGTLYVTNYASGTISIIDTFTGAKNSLAVTSASYGAPAIAEDGASVYIALIDGHVVEVDATSDTIIQTVTVGGTAVAITTRAPSSQGSAGHPRIVAAPTSVPADGASTASVTLTGAPAGHKVRFFSSLPSVAFNPASGVASGAGQFVTTVKSASSGETVLTARDLDTGQTFAASALVKFIGESNPPDINSGEASIVNVQTQHPLDARYLEGISVPNNIKVVVDWKGQVPGHVDFILNGKAYSRPPTNPSVDYTFDMGKDLRSGTNSLSIIAYTAAGKPSKSQEYALRQTPLDDWVLGLRQMGFIALPLFASGDSQARANYSFGIRLPPYELDLSAPGFAGIDAPTRLGFYADGKMSIPIFCPGQYKASLTGGNKYFQFLGARIDGSIGGELKQDINDLCVSEKPPSGKVFFQIEAIKNIYRKPVLVMITYFNAPVAIAFEQSLAYLHLQDMAAKVLGEFYIDGKVRLKGSSDLAFTHISPYFQMSNFGVEGGLGIEGGYRYNLPVAEIKAWAGADGTARFTSPGPLVWPPTHNLTFDNIIIKGEVGAKVRSGWFQQEVRGEILWEYPPVSTRSAAPVTESRVDNWHLIDHNSPENYARFNSRSVRLNDASMSALTTNASPLVTNVYTYTEPALALNLANDNALMLWVHDDIAKPVGQSQEIRFSRWNGSSWSVPGAVTNDSYLDGAPQVAWASDGRAVAVWQRLNAILPPSAVWNETTAKQIEIATATYDPAAGAWSPVTLLTGNSALDMTPRIARSSGGQLLAVWRQNQAGFLGGDAGNPDRIMFTFHSGTWGAPATAVAGIPGLVDLAAGYGSGKATIAYTRYLTPTGAMTPTLQLFTSTWNGSAWSAPMRQTNDSLGHRSPQVIYNSANQPLLVWLAGPELRLRNLDTGATAALTMPGDLGSIDEFRVVQDQAGNVAAVFTAQATQRDLHVALFDQAHTMWGQPARLTDDRSAEGYPSPAIDATGRLLLGYTTTAIASDVRSTTLPDTGQVVTYTLPLEGQTDLMTLAHMFTRNMTLIDSGLSVSEDRPTPGSSITLTATISNSGDLALGNPTVSFYDGEPSSGGTLLGTRSLGAPLPAGSTATLALPYTVSASGGGHVFYAVADPANSIAESNEADNTAHLAAFGPDLELADASVEFWGGSDVGLVTLVRNLGTTTSPTATITFYRDTLDGVLLASDAVPPLAAGEAITITTPWNFGALPSGSYPIAVAVNQADFAETFTSNNAHTVTLDVRPDIMISPLYLWSTPLDQPTAVVTATVYNTGSIAAQNIAIGLYRRDTLDETALLLTYTIPNLPPGGAVDISGQVSGPFGCGIYVLADPAQAIAETTRSNNLAAIPLEGGRCANFTNTPESGVRPLTAVFTDTSSGANTGWLWSFGDGSTSALQNPSHVYKAPGIYDVTLQVSGPGGSDTFTRSAAVTVHEPARAAFTAAALSGLAPLQISFTDQSTGDITGWSWDFGDGSGSYARNPAHSYTTPGTYSISLTVSGRGGVNTLKRTDYIAVYAPPQTVHLPLVRR